MSRLRSGTVYSKAPTPQEAREEAREALASRSFVEPRDMAEGNGLWIGYSLQTAEWDDDETPQEEDLRFYQLEVLNREGEDQPASSLYEYVHCLLYTSPSPRD